jgi:formate hydrogenlyase transcriptional activator
MRSSKDTIYAQGNEELGRHAINLEATPYVVTNPGYVNQSNKEFEQMVFLAGIRRPEAAAQENQTRYRLATTAAGIGVWDWDLETGEMYIDPALKSTLGYEEHEIGNHLDDWRRLLHPEDSERVIAHAQAHIGGETPRFEVEHRMIRKGGGFRWFLARGMVVGSPDGKSVRLVGTNIDITDRKLSEDALGEGRFRAMADAAPVMIWICGTDMLCNYVNRGWLEFTGRTMQQELGHGWADRVHPEDYEQCLKTYVESFEARRRFRMVYRISRHDGVYRWMLDAGAPRYAPDGQFLGYIGSAMDITERIEAENECRLAEQSLESALAEVQQLKDRLHAENTYLQEEIDVARDFGEIIGCSDALKRVLDMAGQVAPLPTTVLILGETGTGKELLAHAIHKLSPRHTHSLVKVNCATLPAQLIESELFGHEKGAFTGAVARRTGRFEIANGGTIFLDEVAELPLDLQSKLLRVLQEGEFEHLGSSRTIRVDVRVIAATNRNLEKAVREGRFRSDLYYRLNIFPITLPPLRERNEDIAMLVTHYAKQLSIKLGKQIYAIPLETMAVLQNYGWPGNIRELRNVIERAAIITQGPKLRLLDSLESRPLKVAPELPPATQPVAQDVEDIRGETLEESQCGLILQTLEKTFWRVEGPTGAAALLGIHPNTLRSRMKKLGITRPAFKETA